ncbi:MAG TPA: hypothetical protein DEB39_08655 [Planctomycetaceae bacterium]|nr:hypothetical protein [Planctomycetaceae bacterium]
MFFFAQVTTEAAARAAGTVFRLGRIQDNADWFWPIVVTGLLLWYVVRRYRKDTTDLRLWVRIFLALLRIAVVVTLLVVYLHPQWERLVGASRVVLLIDTSASMSNRDVTPGSQSDTPSDVPADVPTESPAGAPGQPNRGPTRLEAVTDWMNRTELIERLREKHDVVLYRFDRTLERLSLESKAAESKAGGGAPSARRPSTVSSTSSHSLIDSFAENDRPDAPVPEKTVETTTGKPTGKPTDANDTGQTSVGGTEETTETSVDALLAEGDQTRLGEALLNVIQRERGEPVSGIILLSDGGQNAGAGIDAVIETAGRTLLPIHAVGIGATRQPLNFKALAIDTAERAFPGDPFTVRARIELLGGETADSASLLPSPAAAPGAASKWNVPVELFLQSGPNDGRNDASPNGGNNQQAAPANVGTEIQVGRKEVEITPGSIANVDFEVRDDRIGKHRLILRIQPPPQDKIDVDDRVETEIEIVDRKDRVLLYAGGPLRDYQFLLAQIFRDKSMQVDAYIPWTSGGVSQSADTILDFFPKNLAEMAKYDCVVAFDPNWSELGIEEINTLEHWVARQGGGLIVVAGAVNMSNTITGWTTDPQMSKIRALYPVELQARGSLNDQRYHGQATPMALRFTRAGEEADFLRPSDDEADSRAVWTEFPGFYGFYTLKGIKPTATLLASLATEQAGTGGMEQSALFVEQYYGAGHVLYIGSPEIWRMRQLDPVYFEKLYTKMIRHVSQGRLQRQSDRGTLTSDKRRYALGSVATLRATINDEQLQPLTEPTFTIDAISPGGKPRAIRLTLDPNVPGTYQGHLPLTEEGDWSVSLLLPDTRERLVRSMRVHMSDLERENLNRNEPLLRTLAEKSGGRYYASPGIAQTPLRESALYGDLFTGDRTRHGKSGVGNGGVDENGMESTTPETEELPPPLLDLLKVRSQRAVLDTAAEQSTASAFLCILAGLLLAEWLFRRLAQLA